MSEEKQPDTIEKYLKNIDHNLQYAATEIHKIRVNVAWLMAIIVLGLLGVAWVVFNALMGI